MRNKFLTHLAKLVTKERSAARFSEERQIMVKNGLAIPKLEASHIYHEPRTDKCFISLQSVNKPFESHLPKHGLSVGDSVYLTSHKSLFSDFNKPVYGIVSEVNKSRISIDLGQVNRENLQFRRSEYYSLFKLSNDTSFKRMMETLENLNSGNVVSPTLCDILLQETYSQELENRQESNVNFFDKHLDTSQREAVVFCLGPNKISLLHGPPGTGKTHTLVEILRQLVEKKKSKVLVCAPSNTAVDNLLSRMMVYTHINSMRYGNPTQVSSSLLSRSFGALTFNTSESIKLSNMISEQIEKFRNGSYGFSSEDVSKQMILKTENVEKIVSALKKKRKTPDQVFKEADIVFCTLNGSAKIPKWNSEFDVVVIDEAGQATEPDCWIAITRGKKLVLSGDHLQLPPTVLSLSIETKDSKPIGMSTDTDLSYTLFDRLLDTHGDAIKRSLTVQYRMNEKIMQFSSQNLYNNELVAHHSVAKHLLSDLPNSNTCEITSTPLVLIDISDTRTLWEDRNINSDLEGSISNDLEVMLIEKYIEQLIYEGGLMQDQIGIITPYAAQVARINSVIHERWRDIEVNSIDGYQGREKECIIISMVRSNNRGDVGFLSDKRRLNVAMTRAKRQLVVIGDTKALSSKRKDRTFLSKWIAWLKKEATKQYSRKYLKL